ncbi:hypothetical protein ACFRDV_22060 [Streptomyces fagopyri]|uniref:hypothetical protein n=1 Tax=Streptomyces fagopyri TaxID=2662397 RepID=UPI0036B551A9
MSEEQAAEDGAVKAYVATSGSYSAYHVQRVFLDKALADKYLADGLCDEIEEFEITTTVTKAVAILRMDWHSANTFNDRPVGENEHSIVRREESAGQPACRHTVHRHPADSRWGASTTVMVEGHDHDRVRKVLSEQVAQAKAELAEPGAAR